MNRLLLVLVLLASLAFPAAASAGPNQESTFQDDGELIYTTPAKRAKVLDTLESLGVDRLRVSVIWRYIAPNAKSRSRPAFNATDPDAYGDAAWFNYDDLVRQARERGLQINFNLTGPSPAWANGRPKDKRIADTFEPKPDEWVQFVAAVGKRYSGDHKTADGVPIPRVDYWSIWNEPNLSGWLTPTWAKAGGRWFERSAALYRDLVDQAWAALDVTGHGRDTILIGDTAPSGNKSKGAKRAMLPLVFIRALYCVNKRFARLKGAAAKRLDCPKSGREMVTQHPALFRATGFAHHPYGTRAPDARSAGPDAVNLGVLSRLTRTLDRVQRRYGQRRKLPIYLTEFGYQTRPPNNNVIGIPLRTQAAFINQSEFIAYKNRRVRTIGQFLLVDDKDPRNFQSGLVLRKGRKPKPAFDAYRLPLWIQGRRVFGVLRPAENGTRATATLQHNNGGGWRTLRKLRSKGRFNVIDQRVRLPRSGSVRIAYGGHTSRTVSLR